jgi:hypothetical protein
MVVAGTPHRAKASVTTERRISIEEFIRNQFRIRSLLLEQLNPKRARILCRTTHYFTKSGNLEKIPQSIHGEINFYYKEHLEEFERVSLARILAPGENFSAPDKKAAKTGSPKGESSDRKRRIQRL